MENIDKNIDDVLLLFKTKIQEAIYLIENMPDDTRRDVWQFWKEVSKIVKTTTRPKPRPAKAKQKTRQIKLEPDIEIIKMHEEVELSVLHLEESVSNQDGNGYDDDTNEVTLPVIFTQDFDNEISADIKQDSFASTPDLQRLYGSVYPETCNRAAASEILNASDSKADTLSVIVSTTATKAVHSSEPVGTADSSSKAARTPDCSSELTGASTDKARSVDSSSLLQSSGPETCEIYTTDGTNAILLSTEIQNKPVEQQTKRRRGRPRKVPTNDVSETHVVKSLPSTGMKIVSVRPKRVRKATESSIYCYLNSKSKKTAESDENEWSDNDVDAQVENDHSNANQDNNDDLNADQDNNDHLNADQDNNDHLNADQDNNDHLNADQDNNDHSYVGDSCEAGDKENEAEDKSLTGGKRKQMKSVCNYDTGPVVCPECGVELAYSSSLAAHMRKHTGARPFKCSHCDKGFTTKANMLRHELIHTGEKPFQCPLCDKAFTEARSLAIHNRTHTGEKPYVCKICNSSFRQLGTLQAHIYCHTGHKGHLCDLCGKAFRQKTQLREHQKRHTNSKSVKCDVCGKMFYGKGELFRHSLQHSGARPYKCSLCDKTFTRLQYLREHTNIHTGNKPYVCSECPMAFHDLASLYRHQLKHKKQAKKSQVDTVDLKRELFGSEVVIVNNDATDEVLQNLIAEAAENGQIQISQSTGSQLQAAAQSILDVSSPVAQVYQITYVDQDNGELGTGVRQDGGQILANVDFSAINLLANATQLSLGQ
ncbi:zinc finger protein 184-like isoform X2 [Gigantopelta aegis]|uniref:zinc finger protein 184-like isoform X2 n=1 Tax=Gigantopelta aegis TaxID=1735272 RepID=UPI001B88D3AE|nr:zinc finger protein 184-like isoform X2 [Gigantopelta aegis]